MATEGGKRRMAGDKSCASWVFCVRSFEVELGLATKRHKTLSCVPAESAVRLWAPRELRTQDGFFAPLCGQ